MFYNVVTCTTIFNRIVNYVCVNNVNLNKQKFDSMKSIWI